jgi:hypothetical protein
VKLTAEKQNESGSKILISWLDKGLTCLVEKRDKFGWKKELSSESFSFQNVLRRTLTASSRKRSASNMEVSNVYGKLSIPTMGTGLGTG